MTGDRSEAQFGLPCPLSAQFDGGEDENIFKGVLIKMKEVYLGF